MREGPPPTVLTGSYGWRCQVSSSLGGDVLADDIPIISGTASWDSSQQVPDSIQLVVPEFGAGRWWVPAAPSDPLARFGQQLSVQVVVVSAVDRAEWTTQLGTYVIQNWEHDPADGTITVSAAGQLQVAADARLTSPVVPRYGSTVQAEFLRLLPDAIAADVDPALPARKVPTALQWDEDRLQALYDLADAWPARLRPDSGGGVRLLPALPASPVPVRTFTDGAGGTVISAVQSDSREQSYNVVVVRASDTDSANRVPFQVVLEAPDGPYGPDRYGAVVRYYSSPLITSTSQARAAAQKILDDSLRGSVQRQITALPDPRLELDDAVFLRTEGFEFAGWVLAMTLPLTAGDGPMSLTIGVP